jgi:amino acid adenylation domain-containing protein
MFKRTDVKDMYSLSPMQEGMLFHYIVDENSTVYVEQMNVRIVGLLDHRLFAAAFNQLIQRHDVLRTIFLYKNLKKPRQVVLTQRTTDIYFRDISQLSDSEKEKTVENFIIEDREAGFDLSRDVPMRFSVLKLSETEYEIIRTFHHIIMDGWCSEILQKELLLLYSHLKDGLPLHLPTPVPYRLFIQWLEKQDKETACDYWKKYLENFETFSRIPCFKEKTNDRYRQARHVFHIDRELTARLNGFSTGKGITLNSIIQSLWGILLQNYNNCSDVVFGCVVSGRPAEIPNIETMVGLFINTVPIRIRVQGDETFTHLVQKVQEDRSRSMAYEYISLADIQKNSPLKRDLLKHTMIFENYPAGSELKSVSQQINLGFSLKERGIEIYEQTNYDMDVIVAPGEEILVRFQYNGSVYDAEIMVQMGENLLEIIKQVTDNWEIPVKKINILTNTQKNQLLYEFNKTTGDYPQDKTIHEVFEEQVGKTPDKPAVILDSQEINYKKLNEKANHLAAMLRTRGVGAETIVSIMSSPSLQVIIGILAILKAGGCFLPVDPGFPTIRKKFILEDSRSQLLLTHPHIFNQDKELFQNLGDREIISLNLNDKPDPGEPANPGVVNRGGDLAYIIYTSGTTGKPKGVMIQHRGIVNYSCWAVRNYVKNEPACFPLYTSISFDLTLTSIFTPLTSGNGIVVYGDDDKEILIQRIIQENKVDIIKLTPSHLKLLRGSKLGEDKPRIKRLIVGGENLETRLAEDIYKYFNGSIEIYNEYGPTETVVGSMIYRFNPDEVWRKSVPIGIPAANTQIYLLDKEQKPVAIGIPGELSISGAGLARGYLGRVELTTQKFVANPFIKGERLYKTGDIARRLPGGNIEFLGRIDNQVKIRGFRIEPAEIEHRLATLDKIKEALVVAKEPPRENSNGEKSHEKYLYAYIVSGSQFTVPELREYLGREIPPYMIPSYFIQIDEIPLTPNGKVDWDALPEADGSIDIGVEYAAPGNDMEELIANIWKKVLSRNKVGIDDNFFDSGGTSIDIIRLTAELNEALKANISITETFRYTTIRSFSEYLTGEKQTITNNDAYHRAESRDRVKERRSSERNKRKRSRNANI